VCKDCGCEVVEGYSIDGVHVHADGTVHSQAAVGHPEEHPHPHPHGSGEERRTLPVGEAILSKNDRLAERNRGYFLAKGLLVLNVLSSPGAGKTAFIQRTAADLGSRLRAGVIVGDLETDNDARRLRQSGLPAVQITTGSVCHLDAEMVAKALERLSLEGLDVLIIENVGNLVCPAAYDLGEDLRVVLFSVTEGEDKPLKYPVMFRTAHVVIVNKIDIAEAAGFDRATALANIRRVAPQATLFEVSARTGQGMDGWYAFLAARSQPGKQGHAPHSGESGADRAISTTV
jgi:hydrogenase nickel incorporation protein HypB